MKELPEKFPAPKEVTLAGIEELLKAKNYQEAVRQSELLLEKLHSAPNVQGVSQTIEQEIDLAVADHNRRLPVHEWEQLRDEIVVLRSRLEKIVRTYGEK
jgi:hypothetical protein